ncbi:MAG: DedA family protein [Jatrophihabitans sp.]|uniref:DedA family protein n=1 Tax=Jatrophihabitans sp. TaxID=1932789 RepID=UPI003F821D2F
MHLASVLGPSTLLSDFGLAGLAAVLFAETGLLIGFFLPGDTILLAAGISVSIGTLKTPIWAWLIVCPLAAIVGNLVGYAIGRRAGPVVFDRPDSRLFKPEYVTRSQAFFDRFGWPTVFVARFVPVVRTVAPVMAGVARMPVPRFTLASVLGGIVWTDGILLIGYALGHNRFVREHESWVDYFVVIVVVIGLIPALVHLVQSRRGSRRR